MKTTKSLLGTMAMSIVAMFLTANLNADVYLYVYPLETSKKAIVELSLPIQSTVTIYVFDNKGQLIHNEDIKKGSSYKRVYDFSNLQTGRYTIISDSEYLKVTKIIKVNETSIEVVSTEYLHRPVFEVKDDFLNIRYLNTAQSNVKISIEDSRNVYYNGNMPGDIVFMKTFDIQKLLPGKYKVWFEADGCKFVHYFTLKQ